MGGGSGVGTSAVAAELFDRLARADVHHCLIEGDDLDLAHPTPWQRGQPLAEMNLAAMWCNCEAFGRHRADLHAWCAGTCVDSLVQAVGDSPEAMAVLLRASDATVLERLRRREIGAGLDAHPERSAAAGRHLDEAAPPWVRRITSDGRTVQDIAADMVTLSGWQQSPEG